MLASLVLAAGAALTACPEEPLCDEQIPLVAMDAFELVDPADDPFSPPADAPLCTGDEVRSEPFGDGPVALDVDTSNACGWATVRQPSRVALEPADRVRPRVFYFSQQTFPASQAELRLRIGDDDVWTLRVPIPTDADVEAPELEPQLHAAEGTPVWFHIGNHGANGWSLLELFRLRSVPCSELEDSAP